MKLITKLSSYQKSKILKGRRSCKEAVVQLTPEQLIRACSSNPGESDTLEITEDQYLQIQQCIIKKVGYRLKLTPEQCGGFLPFLPAIIGAVATVATGVANNIINHNTKKKELAELARHHRKLEESQPKGTEFRDVDGKPVNKEVLYEMYPDLNGAELKGSGAGTQAAELRSLEQVVFSPLKTSDFTDRNIKVFMRDTIPSPLTEKYGVINYDSTSGKGTHWVCFFRTSLKTVYFFDSYGNANPPKELVASLGPNTQIRINRESVQRTDESYPICAHLCLTFLKMMKLPRHPSTILESMQKRHLEYASNALSIETI